MTEVKIQFRMPIDVRDWFKEMAERESRSMNRQFTVMIRQLMAQERQMENAPAVGAAEAFEAK